MVIELYEKGFLTKGDTGGVELSWGNSQAVRTLLNQIADREGAFANVLAEGVAKSADALRAPQPKSSVFTP